MEPQVQYATTRDSVRVAYAALGEGPPILVVSNLFGELNFYLGGEQENRRDVDGLLERGWRVVLYDLRGCGSSDREVTDFSLESRLLDLEAITDALCLQTFALAAWLSAGPVAIAFAAKHADRVSQLILVNTYASGPEYYESLPAMRQSQDTLTMAKEQWEFHTLALANAVTGFSSPGRAQQVARLMRDGMTPDGYLAFRDAAKEIDVTEATNGISVPTLVVHDRSSTLLAAVEPLTRKLASRIPGARFVAVDAPAPVISDFLKANVNGRPAVLSQRASGAAVPQVETTIALTAREVEVLRLIALGRSNRQIADELTISINTADRHVSNILTKIGASNRAQAASYAVRSGIAT